MVLYNGAPCNGAPLCARRRAIDQVKGPARFFYDKASYTGTHSRGGPDKGALSVPAPKGRLAGRGTSDGFYIRRTIKWCFI